MASIIIAHTCRWCQSVTGAATEGDWLALMMTANRSPGAHTASHSVYLAHPYLPVPFCALCSFSFDRFGVFSSTSQQKTDLACQCASCRPTVHIALASYFPFLSDTLYTELCMLLFPLCLFIVCCSICKLVTRELSWSDWLQSLCHWPTLIWTIYPSVYFLPSWSPFAVNLIIHSFSFNLSTYSSFFLFFFIQDRII